MKLKHVLASAVALLCSVATWADTSLLTAEKGWQKLTAIPSNVGDYYYAIVDDGSDLMLTLSRGKNQGNAYNGLYYKTSGNPLADKSMLFTLSAEKDCYVMTNVEYNGYFLQTEDNAARYYRTHDNGGKNREWGKIKMTYADSKWTIQNGRYYVADGNYLGVWNDNAAPANGQELALNKPSKMKGTYQIYAIAKTDADAYYDALRAGTGAREDKPIDMTALIVNPNARFWTGSIPYGWETTGLQNIHGGAGFDGFPGIFEFSNWGASSWDGSLKQTITVPNGKYILKAALMGASGVTAYIKANSDQSENLAHFGDKGGNINADGTETTMGNGQRGYTYLTVNTTVTNGKIEIGAYATASAQHLWINADNFTLTYLGPASVDIHKALIADNKGDITGLINGTFDANATGWTGYNNYITHLGRSWRGNGINPYIETTSTGTMTTRVGNMPAGTYKVVAAARSYNGGKLQAQVADGYGAELTGTGDKAPAEGTMEINTNGVEMPYSSLGGFTTVPEGHNWHWITATGTLAEAGDLVINFNTTGNGWMAIDDVHLYCTQLDGTSYTKTLPTIDGNTDLSDYADGSVVTSDIVVRNPNAMMYSGNGYDITTAAGASLNNFMYKKAKFGGVYWAANVVLYDGLKYATPENDKGLYFDNARLYRKFPADTWCTLVLPFWPNDGKFTKKYPSALSGDGVLTFSDATNSTWDTNDKPMLVKSSEDVSVITGGRKGAGFAGTATGNMTSGAGATMNGTYAKINDISSLGGTNYVLGTDNKLYKVDSPVSLAPFRAYFTVDAGTGVKANIITLNLDGTETAIECIDNVQTTKGNDVIYNLAGQRLSKMQKGVNIVNGKKIFVK